MTKLSLGYSPCPNDTFIFYALVHEKIATADLHFAQPLKVLARIVEWELRLKLDYEIRDAVSGELLTRAHTIQIAVDVPTRQMQYVCPSVLWERLGVSPA